MNVTSLVLLLVVQRAGQAPPDDGRAWLMQALGSLVKSESVVFATRCIGVDSDNRRRRETLLFAPDRDLGLLIEESGSALLNTATFSASTGPGEELETNGGEYSRRRVGRLVAFLKMQPFWLVGQPLVSNLESIEVSSNCKADLL